MPLKKKLSRKEKRLQRALKKQEIQQKKAARLSELTVIQDKYVRIASPPPLHAKNPRSSVDPFFYKNCYFSWCITHSDRAGEWEWHEKRDWSRDEYSNIIEPHLQSHDNEPWSRIETKTYNGRHSFRKSLNKYQPLCSICNDAQSRWLSLEFLSQFDELFRMRLGSNRRIWGVRIEHHFFVVWYERHHLICPVKN